MIIKYSFLICFIITLQLNGFSKDNNKYKEYLNIEKCPIDSNANAFFINKDCLVKIYYDPDVNKYDPYYKTTSGFFKTKIKYNFLIKIINKESEYNTNRFFQLYFSIYKGTMITKKKAQTISLQNNEIVYDKVNNDDIFLDLYAENLYTLKIPFNNIKNGCLLEAEIEIQTGLAPLFPTWIFQDQIPVLSSRYETILPEYYTFRKNISGFIQPSSYEEEQSTFVNEIDYIENHSIIKYINIPALNYENYAGNIFNYLAKADYELTSVRFPRQPIVYFGNTWDKIFETLSKSEFIGGQLNQNANYLDDVVMEINTKEKTNEDKLKTAYNYIQKSLKWNNQYSIGSSNGGIRQAYKNKEGTSGEINLLLVKILNLLGIEAYPAVMSTIENGLISYFPALFSFNNTIVYAIVDGKTYLMDASIKGTPFGILSENLLNDRALVLMKPGLTWVDLKNTLPSYEVYNISANLNTSKILEGEIGVQYKNYALANYNKAIKSNTDVETYINKLEADYKISISNNTIEPNNIPEDKVSFQLDFTSNDIITSNKVTYFNPLFFLDLNKNPFTAEKRNYPIIFNYPKQITYIININLAEGQEILEVPKPVNIKLPNNEVTFMYQSSVIKNSIQIVCKFNINKTLYEMQDYFMLKELFDQIIRKYNEQIAIKTN